MKLKNCIIVPAHPDCTYLLTNVAPSYLYANGVRTGETDGWRYTVLIPQLGYDTLTVKISGAKQMDVSGPNTYVAFDGLEIKPYIIDGKLIVSAHATGVRPTKGNN